jgi:CubicO group peptidase (beta-lactamase class C family)
MLTVTGCTHGNGQASRPPSVGRAGPFPAASEFPRYLDGLSAQGRLSGTVLVTPGPDAEYGRLRLRLYRQKRIPNTAQTEFRLGSASKQFTATGVLILQDPSPAQHVRPLLPLPARLSPPVAAGHDRRTPHPPSGIGATSTIWGTAWPSRLSRFRDRPLHFAPGTRMRYSNSGYVLR